MKKSIFLVLINILFLYFVFFPPYFAGAQEAGKTDKMPVQRDLYEKIEILTGAKG